MSTLAADDPNATVIAIIALAVSVVAMLFTGWQALTAYLERTRPRPARWTIEYPDHMPNGRWTLHNSGGSLATRVVVSLRRKKARGEQLRRRIKKLVSDLLRPSQLNKRRFLMALN